jgi:predicted glutamine amidotransferase
VNAIVASRDGLVAVRSAEPDPPNSLYYLSGEPRWRHGSLVASEPLDDGPGWHEVRPSKIILADAEGPRTEPLDLPSARRDGGRS